MKRKSNILILILILLFITGCAGFNSGNGLNSGPVKNEKGEETGYRWTTTNTALFLADLVLTTADYSQTLYISEHPDKYYEKNTILGKHPTRREVNTYFPVYFAFKTFVSWVLPNPYRMYWQGGMIGMDGYYVINNANIGIGFAW